MLGARAGEAAERFEQLPMEQAVARLMRVLRTIYTPQGIEVPEPLQVSGGPAGLLGLCVG